MHTLKSVNLGIWRKGYDSGYSRELYNIFKVAQRGQSSYATMKSLPDSLYQVEYELPWETSLLPKTQAIL